MILGGPLPGKVGRCRFFIENDPSGSFSYYPEKLFLILHEQWGIFKLTKQGGIPVMKLFKNWDYKKHAKVISAIYLTSYAIDMTIGYILVKKTFDEEGNLKKIK